MDSTGKIGKRGSLLDNDAVYVNQKTSASAGQAVDAKTIFDAKTAALKLALEGSNLGGEDTVNLSVSQAIQAAFGDDSAARSKKVADLKAKVANGQYVVDTKATAREVANEIAQAVYFGSTDSTKNDGSLF